ncbi:MAG: GIY-YIG nuclease family protein [Pseudomonadota bacterium]
MAFYTYIVACKARTAIYIGVTGDLHKRMVEQKSGFGSEHTRRYRIRDLVYFEVHEELAQAIARERKLKRWRRAWKDDRIKEYNPRWHDLTMEVSFL